MSESSSAVSQWQPRTELALPDGWELRKVDAESYAVTTYKGEPATQKEITDELTRLHGSFPQTAPSVLATIVEYVKAEGWPLQRLRDAVANVVKTNQYPTIMPAAVLSYDRPKKLYNYLGYCNKIGRGEAEDSDFGKVIINGKCFFYLLHENDGR